ncbi:ABC transporter substrate-binding protein [Sulfitobacter pseudonitzschiae]|uniref:ABC transporter substrate-binding protein n=1 Tax=Pseudosulfitobacter pseudonitzschiae TaxID=1402135 RepID=A0A9Q2NLK5_9RHOB|nr:ABC transporter substrate-binding protein [Pseudosulfitobacter pseudonitzschiae]MBM2293201.1 ABC transporter substrate-binding protein [Pseudosulfitobacter pseudonitzschiae]MBM2297888.1 ABC transporter substrate-binding protein [Pseudosulfitobacter pseudonitzschiae]MBM2302802.1 ABC transporter substrate-binding protein [Pseudosulfitobacter pseudonitzschiae]MBM2312532.1 ABC transporter substrate-binding protein [Pseudosulfitobacter pseudonitzschiae]MBM2317498.1 ABC transporter substrate-bind|tara:strand:- start:51942 stop:53570 length:1629 start_codon:yes stop_codon:yes gene_type:complete
MLIHRRHALGLLGAAAGSLALPGLSFAQSQRRTVTIAVQKITNNNTLDVWNEQSNVGERVFFPNLWEGLINRNWMGDQGGVPGLATSWKRLDDKTIELKLREGVKFHNGDEMTADDVVFSFSDERVFAGTQPDGGETLYADNFKPKTDKELPAGVPGVGRRLWPALRGVEAVDKYTVRFHNASPDVTLEGRMIAFGSQIASRRAWDEAATYADWANAPVTTGAYKVQEYRPDVSLTLVAHDDYWGGRPPLAEIRFLEVPEVASRVNGLLSGEYDFACDLPPDQLDAVRNTAGLEVQGSTILNHRIQVFDKVHPVLSDPLIRRAMTHSIDRQLIVNALWDGQTKVPAGLQFEFYDDMFIKGWTAPEFNLEMARDLVKQSGYQGDAIPFRVLNNYYINQVSNAQIMVEMWKQAGLNVEIQMVENWGQVLEDNDTRGIRDWSNSATFNDPVSSIVAQHGPNGLQQQRNEWTNVEMNELSNFMQKSTDRAARKKAFARMLEITEREDPAFQVLHQNCVFTGMKSDLNWKAAPAFAMDFRADNWNAS